MGRPRVARSFLEQLAEYDDPTPKDFDPEADSFEPNGTNLGSSEDDSPRQEEAREHYTEVGRSRLRNSDGLDLGSQYSGARVSRNALQNAGSGDEDDDELFTKAEPHRASGAEDLEVKDSNGLVKTSGRSLKNGNDIEEGEDDDHHRMGAFPDDSSRSSEALNQDDDDDGDDEDDEDDEDHGEESDSDSSPPPTHQTDRATLRRMMADEQKSVAATLSAAASADVTKGKAIKKQRSTFDSLLSTRIKLQKALIASNSLAATHAPSAMNSNDLTDECASASHAAEEAALKLWKSITSLRHALYTQESTEPALPTTGRSSQALWKQSVSLDAGVRSQRRATLTKWSQRTNPVTTLRPQNRFSQTPTQQPLTSMLDQQLAGDSMDRAIKRTRTARSCAPVQAASKFAMEDEDIYDDADFYCLLLRELVDRRMTDTHRNSTSSVPPASGIASIVPSRTELKVKKQVDTKASKGRKMRYTVHEKLQNFMAPDERGSWGERQRAELFGSLLGRKVDMAEADGNDEEMEDNDAMDVDAGEFKLFG